MHAGGQPRGLGSRRLEAGHHVRRDRLRLEAAGAAGIAYHPDPRLGRLDRQRPLLGQPVLQREARAADLGDLLVSMETSSP